MSKWRCVSIPGYFRSQFTIGKIYELDDNTDELVCDDGYCYGRNHQHDDCGGTIAWLKESNCVFEEAKDMFGKDNLKTGMLVKFRNGYIGLVMLNDAWGCSRIIEVNDDTGSASPFMFFYDDDLVFDNGKNKQYDIMEVRKSELCPDLSQVEKDFEQSSILWKREEPKELTVGQIEEILGYKIKVVANKEGD